MAGACSNVIDIGGNVHSLINSRVGRPRVLSNGLDGMIYLKYEARERASRLRTKSSSCLR